MCGVAGIVSLVVVSTIAASSTTSGVAIGSTNLASLTAGVTGCGVGITVEYAGCATVGIGAVFSSGSAPPYITVFSCCKFSFFKSIVGLTPSLTVFN